jgi:heptosyltransferase-3
MTKNILFITSTRIGDAVLSTGVLSYILRAYPEARITVACGPLVESLFEGVPQLERIIPLQKQSWNRHWLKLWRKTIRKRWDIVIDLRNSAISHLILAENRFAYGPHINRAQHKVAQNASIIHVEAGSAEPRLFLTADQMEKAKILIPDGRPVLGVGPTANWVGKIWPVENFMELIATLTKEGEIFSGWRIAVFGAPGEEAIANQLYDSLPEDTRINCIAKGSPGQAAAYIARCQFYVGNDSGLMHSAAAAGIQTVGLFGPTNDELYAPYGPRTALIRTPETLTELIGAKGFEAKAVKESLMKNLTVQTVEQGIKEFLKNSSLI